MEITSITQLPTWKQLQAHQQIINTVHMRDMFAEDSERFLNFSLQACDLLLDYSKNRVTSETMNHLFQFANEVKLQDWIKRMFKGEKINHTEQRAVLHTALRYKGNDAIEVDGHNVVPDVQAVLNKIHQFVTKVHEAKWLGHTGKAIDTIVNIGIGGSDLGPVMVSRALKTFYHPCLQCHFVSNVDATHLGETLKLLNPETTLFIVASKTFTTQETMLNANSARHWLVSKLKDESAVAKHFVALSTAREEVIKFGINPDNMFEFWDWVGGRYSLWSAIGLSIAVMIGMDNFGKLLNGAYEMDQHFLNAPFEKNMPVIMGLLGVWYTNFFDAKTHVILPYDYALEYFPAYSQQLIMESLGKRVTREGKIVDYATCPITWGAAGNNGQHAFYQLLHQGTHIVPADFIVAIESQYDLPGHQDATLSNAFAQTLALMKGRTEEEARAKNMAEDVLPHRLFPGNQPTNTLVYKKLTPTILGKLIALYEHKTFVQGVCWGLNPFDQWGVELGKEMAGQLLPAIQTKGTVTAHDASTNGLLNYVKSHRS